MPMKSPGRSFVVTVAWAAGMMVNRSRATATRPKSRSIRFLSVRNDRTSARTKQKHVDLIGSLRGVETLWHEHDLPKLVCRLEQVVRRLNFLQRQNSIDVRGQTSLGEDQPHDRLSLGTARHRRADNRVLLPEEGPKVDLDGRAGRRTIDHDPSPFDHRA